MELQKSRLFLIISLFLIGIFLFSEWQREHSVVVSEKEVSTTATTPASASDIPSLSPPPASATSVPVTDKALSAELIEVNTDVLKVKIDPNGGDLILAELVKYPEKIDSLTPGERILDKSDKRNFVAQTGLIGKDEQGPDSKQFGRAHYVAAQKQYQMQNDPIRVDLLWDQNKGVKVTKTYVFKPNSYIVQVIYHIQNATNAPWQGSFYGQLRRVFHKEDAGGGFLSGIQVYQGAAYYTPDKPYKKLSFSDMKKKPLKEQVQGGWATFQQHYFLAAWVPQPESVNQYYTRVDADDTYNIGAVTAVDVPANGEQTVMGQFYIGPEKADLLKEVSPGLHLTVDYGILWPISMLIFWLLKNIHQYVGNWGWSIILVTLVIKIMFYKLSAASYRSMGRMRKMQPKMEALKVKHGDDKAAFSKELMQFYRDEKINPLGGCLPIVIQIPVFIALYYVLLESIELRHAPFIFWIRDLSAQDPYYVLPLIMGATMFLQQRMNPAPPDPIQAKMMMFMPVVFTALFLSFPAGLVLYWTANNILSIAQQWWITRNMDKDTVPKKGK